MSEINKSRAEYIMNHYSNTKKDILVLAKHLDEHDKDLQQRIAEKDLEIMRLREALIYHTQQTRPIHQTEQALSTPPDTTALDEYVKQRLGDVVYVSHYSRTQEQVEGGCTVPVYLVKD